MNTWTPIFSKIVDSSIWAEPDFVVKVFLTMLALKDADQVVRYNAFALAQRSHKTEQEVIAALKKLSEPDTKRIEPQPHEGRRIRKVEDGWLLLNGQYYEDMMRNLNRRAYKTAKQREYRLKGKSPPREKAFVKADGDGNFEQADAIAAEGLEKNGAPVEEDVSFPEDGA